MALLVAVFLPLFVKAALAESDWEYWSQFEAKIELKNDLSLLVKPELRFSDDMSDHYYTHLEIGLDWKVNSWLAISPCYRHVEQKKNDNWSTEKRPHLNATIKWKMSEKIKMSNRFRLEYRIMESNEAFRYTNKTTLFLPSVTELKIEPYLADEFFYDFDEGFLNKNRIFAGAEVKITENWKAGIAYILESRKKGDDWTDVNVLVTTIKYSF